MQNLSIFNPLIIFVTVIKIHKLKNKTGNVTEVFYLHRNKAGGAVGFNQSVCCGQMELDIIVLQTEYGSGS